MQNKYITIALYGGSFDPPHIGHEAIIKALNELDYIDKIIIMPAFLNPFKSQSYAPGELRFTWLQKIFKKFKNVQVNRYELDQKIPVSTIKSVKHLLKTYKKVYVVIGADNLKDLDKWNNFEELKKLVTFIVASRDNIIVDEKFINLNIDEDVSSSELRKNINISMLPAECAAEIEKHYKNKDLQCKKE